MPAFSGLLKNFLYILRSRYANELGTIGASGASWQLPSSQADKGIGLRFFPMLGTGVEIPAKKDFIFIIFFRRDFQLLLVDSMAAFLFVVVVVLVRGLTVLSSMASAFYQTRRILLWSSKVSVSSYSITSISFCCSFLRCFLLLCHLEFTFTMFFRQDSITCLC